MTPGSKKLLQAAALACSSIFALATFSAQSLTSHTLETSRTDRHVVSPRVPVSPTTKGSASQDYLGAIGKKWLYHWPQEKFPIKVYIAPGNRVTGYHSTWKQLLTNAFDEWSQVCDYKVSWVPVSSPKGADVVCSWTNCMPGTDTEQEAGDTGTLVQTDHSTGITTILQADMKLLSCLDGEPFTDEQMQKICLHEVGHAFGMQGHSPTPTDLMYPETTDRQPIHLTSRDIASMRKLYQSYQAVGMGSTRGYGQQSTADAGTMDREFGSSGS